MPVQTEKPQQPFGEFVAAHRLAGFRPAELDDMAARRGLAIIVIEADNAVNLGARQVEPFAITGSAACGT
jgi:hypothetical protein